VDDPGRGNEAVTEAAGRRPVIGVMGASAASPAALELARRLGRLIAEAHGKFLGASPSVKAELKARYGMPVDMTVAGARE